MHVGLLAKAQIARDWPPRLRQCDPCPVPTPRIIAVGASAGGLETLLQLSRELPPSLSAPVCIVLHIPPQRSSALPDLLNRARRLHAEYVHPGQPIAAGRIYVAPPDSHFLIEDGHAVLGRGPRENGSRPAVDPLFRSVAQGYGPGAIGVVLSGAWRDGTAGLAAIKALGGTAVVQDPEQALHSCMPKSALEHVAVDHVVASAELARLLERLIAEHGVEDGHAAPEDRGEIKDGCRDPLSLPGRPWLSSR